MKARIIMLLLISLSCTLFAQKNDTESLPINSRFSEISPVGREIQEQSGLKLYVEELKRMDLLLLMKVITLALRIT